MSVFTKKNVKPFLEALFFGPLAGLFVGNTVYVLGLLLFTAEIKGGVAGALLMPFLFSVLGLFYAYPVTLVVGMPIILVYERLGFRQVWPFLIVGPVLVAIYFGVPVYWRNGDVASLLALMGLNGATCAYFTARFYFRTKYGEGDGGDDTD